MADVIVIVIIVNRHQLECHVSVTK